MIFNSDPSKDHYLNWSLQIGIPPKILQRSPDVVLLIMGHLLLKERIIDNMHLL
jgi:hypothetical protein